jgi:ketol-acid reductoisomerase
MVRIDSGLTLIKPTSIVVLFLLVPDQVQPRIYNGIFAPHMKDGSTVVIASGYNVFFKLLNFKPSQDVVMVAPRLRLIPTRRAD